MSSRASQRNSGQQQVPVETPLYSTACWMLAGGPRAPPVIDCCATRIGRGASSTPTGRTAHGSVPRGGGQPRQAMNGAPMRVHNNQKTSKKQDSTATKGEIAESSHSFKSAAAAAAAPSLSREITPPQPSSTRVTGGRGQGSGLKAAVPVLMNACSRRSSHKIDLRPKTRT